MVQYSTLPTYVTIVLAMSAATALCGCNGGQRPQPSPPVKPTCVACQAALDGDLSTLKALAEEGTSVASLDGFVVVNDAPSGLWTGGMDKYFVRPLDCKDCGSDIVLPANPLQYAAFGGQVDVVSWLLKAQGMTKCDRGSFDWSPGNIASCGDNEAVKKLLPWKWGESCPSPRNASRACQAAFDGDLPTLQALARSGTAIASVDGYVAVNSTLSGLWTGGMDKYFVRPLDCKECGSDIVLPANPLQYAAFGGQVDVVSWLLKAQGMTKCDRGSFDWSPGNIASCGDNEAVKKLLPWKWGETCAAVSNVTLV